jgi:NAD(P)-dependent dehydrogenase (short-subunit alcohol dehydrogenase family)
MTGRFENRVVLITGGTSGIGRVTASMFAAEGARVAVCGRRDAEGQDTVREIEAAGGTALFVQADVSRAAEIEACVDAIIKAYGQLDCLFNNAGISGPVSSLLDLDEETWDSVIDVNLKGMFLSMKYGIRAMLRNKPAGGVVVNMSSVLGNGGVNILDVAVPAYMASKHGVIGLTKSAALEFAQKGVRINAICPAYIRTPMFDRVIEANPEMRETLRGFHPIGRFGTSEEVAEAVLWLCSDASSFVVGTALPVDGGFRAK